MSRYAVSLGSNQGDRVTHLRIALGEMGRLGRVDRVSPLYETAPVGGPDQDAYLNAVAVVETDLSPHEVLARLQEIEASEGRVRTVRWGPRTLDLDIIAWSEGGVARPDLTIPHPRAAEREFVLRPLADVWPDASVGANVTAEAALDRQRDQGVDRLANNWVSAAKPVTGRYLVAAQLAIFGVIALAWAVDGSLPADAVGGTRLIGGAVAAAGGLLTLVSSWRLRAALTPVPEPVVGGALIETGPYSLARHPIYGGIILFMLGVSLMLHSFGGALLGVGLGVFFYFKFSYEEKRLRIHYASYRAYRKRVRRRLIPFLI